MYCNNLAGLSAFKALPFSELKHLYEVAGLTYTAIADNYGINRNVVSKEFKRHANSYAARPIGSWLVGKRQSDEVIAARSAGMKRALMNPTLREKYRKNAHAVVAKAVAARLKKYATDPEFKTRVDSILAANSPDAGHLHTPEMLKKAQARRCEVYYPVKTGVECTAPRLRKGPDHFASIIGSVTDPNGRLWQIRNLKHFVRTHEHLFDSDCVVWRPSGGAPPSAYGTRLDSLTCRAYAGLQTVLSSRRFSWHGWTLASRKDERHGKPKSSESTA